jgi:hypothetical protein
LCKTAPNTTKELLILKFACDSSTAGVFFKYIAGYLPFELHEVVSDPKTVDKLASDRLRLEKLALLISMLEPLPISPPPADAKNVSILINIRTAVIFRQSFINPPANNK